MTYEDLNGVFERSVRTPNLDPRRLIGPVVPSVPVRERVRRIEGSILAQHLGKVTLYTGSTRAARSDGYWDRVTHVPDFGHLRTWMDTRPLTRPDRMKKRQEMRWIPVLKADLEDFSVQQRQVMRRVLERLRLDGGRRGKRQDPGSGRTNLSLKVVREVDRLQTIQEDLTLGSE